MCATIATRSYCCFQQCATLRKYSLSVAFSVRYFRLSEGLPDLEAALKKIVAEVPVSRVRVCAPGEYRLWHSMQTWTDRLGLAVDVLEDTRFLCTLEAFNDWADGKKQLRMEFFLPRDAQALSIAVR